MPDANALEAPKKKKSRGIGGAQKAAMMLVTLGPERAAKIFGHLNDHEIETLSVEMAKMRNMDAETTEEVLEEAVEFAYATGYLGQGGLDYAHDVLERTLGKERAEEMIRKLSAVVETRPFEFLRRSPPEQITAFLRSEAPQTMALVIANLDTMLAAEVMINLPPDTQADVALRVATMNETSPDVIKEIEGVMRTKLASVISQEYSAAGGVDSLVDILNRADRATERNVIDKVAEADPDLAEAIRMKLFVFEDVVKLDDRSIQRLLKDVDQKDLAIALRGVPDEVKDKVLSNMSARAAEMLQDELAYQPPQKRRVVEEAQGRIVARVRALEEADEINIGRGDGDDELVG
jgi:flagellar motor switch protein FliG